MTDPPTNLRDQRRTTFDAAALLYDAVRPGYPAALIDDVIALAGLPAGGRILEIGSGSGQATLPFAERGHQILCIELGEQLAAVARAKLAGYPGVTVVTGAFETWPAPEGAFDLVMAATSFHWIDPVVGYAKVARALRPGGALALFWNSHVWSPQSAPYFDALQAAYRRAAPEMARNYTGLPRPDQLTTNPTARIAADGLFGPVTTRLYPWDATYDAAGYVRLLQTYSDHLSQPPDVRAALLADIADIIDRQLGGHIIKSYLADLYVTRRTG